MTISTPHLPVEVETSASFLDIKSSTATALGQIHGPRLWPVLRLTS